MVKVKKETKKKTVTNQKKKENSTDTHEMLSLGHLIKYNLYLLAKAVVFSSVLKEKQGNINEAANYAHAIMMAFHDQDHRVDVTEEKK